MFIPLLKLHPKHCNQGFILFDKGPLSAPTYSIIHWTPAFNLCHSTFFHLTSEDHSNSFRKSKWIAIVPPTHNCAHLPFVMLFDISCKKVSIQNGNKQYSVVSYFLPPSQNYILMFLDYEFEPLSLLLMTTKTQFKDIKQSLSQSEVNIQLSSAIPFLELR